MRKGRRVSDLAAIICTFGRDVSLYWQRACVHRR